MKNCRHNLGLRVLVTNPDGSTVETVLDFQSGLVASQKGDFQDKCTMTKIECATKGCKKVFWSLKLLSDEADHTLYFDAGTHEVLVDWSGRKIPVVTIVYDPFDKTHYLQPVKSCSPIVTDWADAHADLIAKALDKEGLIL